MESMSRYMHCVQNQRLGDSEAPDQSELRMVVAYSTVQLTGGIAAAFVGSLLCGKAVPLAVSPGFGLIAACICEFLYTFMLCFVVLNVAAAKKNKEEKGQYFAVAIGFCIIAGAYGAGTISGAAFNPAVAISLDVSSPGFGTSIIYAFVELLAGVAAAWLFKHVRPEDFGSERSHLLRFCWSKHVGAPNSSTPERSNPLFYRSWLQGTQLSP